MGDNLSAIDLGTDFGAIQLHCGLLHSCALSTNFELKCWGSNVVGQLGQEDNNNRGDDTNEMGDYLNPIDLGSEFNVSSVRCGYYHTCALSSDYNVKCWGANGLGQLGYGDTVQRGDGVGEMGDNLPVLDLGTDFEPRTIGISHYVTSMLSANGTLKSFGWGVSDFI